ncbi:FadR/GntR family transcriptional regulator [Dongia sp.]|uniref:FadR/GntR family transcriptional regulator n=1 Tax=Dongia sp. TaxID=1977262 RepID=UPI0035AD9390
MLSKREGGRPFVRRSIHSQILNEVGERILSGVFMPGDILPSENALSDEFKVSRPVMREAIKVLAAKGLVDPRPKIGTRVRGREQWNMLDPDILNWSFASREAEQYAIHLSEMRRVLEPEAAALAAERATPEQIERISQSFAGMESCPEDTPEHIVHDLRFHQGILEATNNPFIASTGHVIESALLFSFKLTSQIEGARTESLPRHRDVLLAIKAQDAVSARNGMALLIDEAWSDINEYMAKRDARRRARQESDAG